MLTTITVLAQTSIAVDPAAHAAASTPALASPPPVVGVVGDSRALVAAEPWLRGLAERGVEVVRWPVDRSLDGPLDRLDWAEGLVLLPSCADVDAAVAPRLHALLRMAWRCGRSLLVVGSAVKWLRALGLDADRPHAPGLMALDGPLTAAHAAAWRDVLRHGSHGGRDLPH